jgi:hypothetical protein
MAFSSTRRRPGRPKESVGRCQRDLLDEDRSWETDFPFLFRLQPAIVPSTAGRAGENTAGARASDESAARSL